MLNKYTFTVFTPTYNRAKTLPRVYESLINQTFKSFEWLIIDDGSIDENETFTLIMSWQEKAFFPIRYVHQENAGKHMAFNKAVQLARGEFFVPLDSDDACFSNTLEQFLKFWQEIPIENRPEFSGICVLCEDQYGELCGEKFIQDKMDSNSAEMYYKYRIKGEKWGFHRTSVLKKFPFPEIQGVRFVPESIVWHAIAKVYKVRFLNEVLRTYYIDNLSKDSLSMRSKNAAEYKARLEYYQWALNNDMGWFFYHPLVFLKYAFQWVRFSKQVHQSIRLSNLKNSLAKCLVVWAFLPASIWVFFERNYVKAE